MPITVAVFAPSDTGIVHSNPFSRHVCLFAFILCLCYVAALWQADPPSKQSYRLRNSRETSISRVPYAGSNKNRRRERRRKIILTKLHKEGKVWGFWCKCTLCSAHGGRILWFLILTMRMQYNYYSSSASWSIPLRATEVPHWAASLHTVRFFFLSCNGERDWGIVITRTWVHVRVNTVILIVILPDSVG
jgi:hypothetical protein